jgi:hypothetical protein
VVRGLTSTPSGLLAATGLGLEEAVDDGEEVREELAAL